jgi:hypothetical protein
MSTLHRVTAEEWAIATECVIGCQGVTYHVPTLAQLDKTIVALSEHMAEVRRTGKAMDMLPGWSQDLDKLIDRRVYMTMLPAKGAPVDG